MNRKQAIKELEAIEAEAKTLEEEHALWAARRTRAERKVRELEAAFQGVNTRLIFAREEAKKAVVTVAK